MSRIAGALVCMLLAWPAFATGATCLFSWESIVRYKNGTPARLTGYKLYSTLIKGVYNDPPITVTLAQLPDKNRPSYTVPCVSGQYWIVLGYSGGRTSDPSMEIRIP